MNWYILVLKRYTDFKGRSRRKEYWMFFLFNFLISLALGFVTGFIGGFLGYGLMLSNIASIIYSLAILIPSIAVAIRRMHDIGRSGWWILCPIVNIVFLFFDSQGEENQFGPNPKAA